MEYQKKPDVFNFEQNVKLSKNPNKTLLDELKVYNDKNNKKMMTNIKRQMVRERS